MKQTAKVYWSLGEYPVAREDEEIVSSIALVLRCGALGNHYETKINIIKDAITNGTPENIIKSRIEQAEHINRMWARAHQTA